MSQSEDNLPPDCIHPLQKLLGKLDSYKNLRDKQASEQLVLQDKHQAVEHLIRSIRNKSLLIDSQDCAILNEGLIKLMIEDYLKENQMDLQEYFNCTDCIDTVAQLIFQLNQLEPLTKLIAILAQHQQKLIDRIEDNCPLYHSHVFKHPAINKKLEAISRLINVLQGEPNACLAEGDLKLLDQSTISKQVNEFIATYQFSLCKHYQNEAIKNLRALVAACEKTNQQSLN